MADVVASRRLVKVERFADLRLCDHVVERDCPTCGGGEHEGLLIRWVQDIEAWNDFTGEDCLATGFEIAPSPSCCQFGPAIICEEDVQAGHVWRWVDDEVTEVHRNVEVARGLDLVGSEG